MRFYLSLQEISCLKLIIFCSNDLVFSQASKKKITAQQFFDSKDYIHPLEEFQKLLEVKLEKGSLLHAEISIERITSA